MLREENRYVHQRAEMDSRWEMSSVTLEPQTRLMTPMGVHQLANKSLVITALELETIWFALLFAATLEK